eukprot:scaffold10623_cov139-Isochrysis_galbana.AAC.7
MQGGECHVIHDPAPRLQQRLARGLSFAAPLHFPKVRGLAALPSLRRRARCCCPPLCRLVAQASASPVRWRAAPEPEVSQDELYDERDTRSQAREPCGRLSLQAVHHAGPHRHLLNLQLASLQPGPATS